MQYLFKPIKAKYCSQKERNICQKVQTFLAVNQFPTLPKDPTDKFPKLKHNTLRKCNKIIDKNERKYLIQNKPSPQH